MKNYMLNESVKSEDFHWNPPNLSGGQVVYEYTGYTYGCISPTGIAVTLVPDETPFFELPRHLLTEIKEKK